MFAIALMSLGIAVLATRQAGMAAKSAADQVELQQKLAIENAQPYVWVDVRPSPANGSHLMLYVGNSGRTLARNIRISTDKELPTVGDKSEELLNDALERFLTGHASLAPGRELRWGLGFGGAILSDKSQDLRFSFKINADGPFGAIPELVYVVDMNDWRGSDGSTVGTLGQISRSLTKVSESILKVEKTIRQAD